VTIRDRRDLAELCPLAGMFSLLTAAAGMVAVAAYLLDAWSGGLVAASATAAGLWELWRLRTRERV